jgi:SAM-dependent methyltransferase
VTQAESVDESAENAVLGTLNGSVVPREAPPAELRMEVPHSARMYDYYLSGKTNYPADRDAAELVLAAFPHVRTAAQQNRAFLHRAVRHLAETGVDQFLDIGAGIPTPPNLHEIAQAVAPKARVVYCDNDPIVLTHARALLASTPEGRTAYVEADLRHPTDILTSPVLAETLDLSRPVALSLISVLHFFPDVIDPGAIVRRLVDALPAGSYLVLSHGTGDLTPEEARRATEVYEQRGIPFQPRSREDFAALVPDGMELLKPGVTMVHRWRPDTEADLHPDVEVGMYGLIARKG